MGMPTEGYQWMIVETYSGRKLNKSSLVHLRPIEGQGLDTSLDVRWRRDIREKYPIGTKFKIRAKLTDREGGNPFYHSHVDWDYEVLE